MLIDKKAKQNIDRNQIQMQIAQKKKEDFEMGIPDPQDLKNQFFKNHCRSVPLRSFKVLHQCYHPSYPNSQKDSKTEYILLLEQHFPPAQQSANNAVSEPPANRVFGQPNYGINTENYMESELEEEEKTVYLQSSQSLAYQQQSLSNRGGSEIPGRYYNSPSIKREEREEQKSDQASVIENTFQVSLWKVGPDDIAVVVEVQQMTVRGGGVPFQNKIFFSQDGNFMILVFHDQERKVLLETRVLDFKSLKPVPDLQFKLASHKITIIDELFDRSKEIKVVRDPQMITLKPKIAEDSGIKFQKDKYHILCFQDDQKITIFYQGVEKVEHIEFDKNVDCSIASQDAPVKSKIENLIIGEDDESECIIFLLKAKVNKVYSLTTIVAPISSTLKNIQEGKQYFSKDLKQSRIDLSPLENCDFKITESFYHKSVVFGGLYSKIYRIMQRSSRSSHLFFLPRQSLFTGIDKNQHNFKLSNLQIPQYPGLKKDLAFISLHEAKNHLFLAKDLFKLGNPKIFECRNTYQMKGKFEVSDQSALDFKSSLQLGYSSILNTSFEIFNRPQISYQLKSDSRNDGALVQIIQKFDVVNINPYIIILEDRRILSFYSMLDPSHHETLEIKEQFLSFTDLASDAFQKKREEQNETIYRHQLCMFLTLSIAGELHLNFIKLPSYRDAQNRNKIEVLKKKVIKTVWVKYQNQQIIKSALVYQPNQKQDNKLPNPQYSSDSFSIQSRIAQQLVVQMNSQIIIVNIESGQTRAYQTNSNVPFLLQLNCSESNSEDQSTSFYFHSIDKGQQQIFQLTLSPSLPSKVKRVHDFNGGAIICMQQTQAHHLLVLDEHLQIKSFRHLINTKKLKIIEEFKIIDDARILINRGTPRIEMVDSAVYINHQFFQMLKKGGAKNNYSEFEQQRERNVERHILSKTRCLGPYLSTDKQTMVYIYNGDHYEQLKQYSQALQQNRQKPFEMNRSVLIDPKFSLLNVPLLSQKHYSLLHADGYQKQVELSTFSPENDIILKFPDHFLAFDIHGNSIPVKIDQNIIDSEVLGHFNVVQIQIVHENLDTFLAFRMQSSESSVILSAKKGPLPSPIYKFSIMRTEDFMAKCLVNAIELLGRGTQKEEVPVLQRKILLAEDGGLYQLTVFKTYETSQSLFVSFWLNEFNLKAKGDEIITIDLNTAKHEKQGTLKQASFKVQRSSSILEPGENQYTSNDIQQDLLIQDVFEVIDDVQFDCDFLILKVSNDQQYQFLVLKNGLEIYYINMREEEMVPKQLDLDLDKGVILQLLPTTDPHILQFQYTQADPLVHYIFTWDLIRNCQVEMHSFLSSAQIPFLNIIRGLAIQQNYFVPLHERNIYNLCFQFPSNFFDGKFANEGYDQQKVKYDIKRITSLNLKNYLQKNIESNIGEYKLSKSNEAMLGLSKLRMSTIQYPFSYLTLQYTQYIFEAYKDTGFKGSERTQFKPILDFLNVSLQNETNILHNFASNEQFLKAFLKEIKSQLYDHENIDALPYIYYCLLPSSQNYSAFDIAALKSPKCMELMLSLLLLDDSQDYMRYIEPKLSKLLQNKSALFLKILEGSCQRFLLRTQGKLISRAKYIPKKSQYINRTKFMNSLTSQINDNTGNLLKTLFCGIFPRTKVQEIKVKTDSVDSLATKASKLQDEDDDIFSFNTQKSTMINFYAYEFENFLSGDMAGKLIRYLNDQKLSSPLFESPFIQAFLDCQWYQFKGHYYFIIGLYSIGFICMFAYYEILSNALEPTMSFTDQMQKHWDFFYMFLPFQIFIAAYLTLFEVKKMIATRNYFLYFVVVYNSLQIILPFIDLLDDFDVCQQSKDKPLCLQILRTISHGVTANFVILGLVMLLYKIKYLNIAKFYITRLYLVIKDVWTLVLAIGVVEFVFAYSYRIIYTIEEKHEKQGFIGNLVKSQSFFSDQWTQLLLLYDNSYDIPNINQGIFAGKFFLLVFLVFSCLLINLILFYFLYAAIIESYNKFSQNLKNQKYFSRAKILYENESLFKSAQFFKGTRYIIKVQAEGVDENVDKGEWDGLSSAIAETVKLTIGKDSERNEASMKFMKQKIIKLNNEQNGNTQNLEQQMLRIRQKNEEIYKILKNIDENGIERSQYLNSKPEQPSDEVSNSMKNTKPGLQFNRNNYREEQFTDQ